ncbi:hypothetical protein R9C00_17020 [Flammeovirgaceae bacterium SG7u.111]|nr:hypothetical protein [Flammeovirgaceae bacterium SG7u.132]WPO33403.1 hypothetical protein R9C00_17020 [Flammeovirgaceae bacterium SG7u.111]
MSFPTQLVPIAIGIPPTSPQCTTAIQKESSAMPTGAWVGDTASTCGMTPLSVILGVDTG